MIPVRGIEAPVTIYGLERGAGVRARVGQPAYASGTFDRRGS